MELEKKNGNNINYNDVQLKTLFDEINNYITDDSNNKSTYLKPYFKLFQKRINTGKEKTKGRRKID